MQSKCLWKGDLYTIVLHIVFELYLKTLFSYEVLLSLSSFCSPFFQKFYKMFSEAETNVQFEHPPG